jgi:hypothetical protein
MWQILLMIPTAARLQREYCDTLPGRSHPIHEGDERCIYKSALDVNSIAYFNSGTA